jgi:hypothetical protein
VSTFSELEDQAEQEIRAHIRSTSSNSTHHLVVDSTNYFVDHGAGDYSRRLGSGESPGERPMLIFERSLISRIQRRWRTLLRCLPTVTILMSFTPASSLKRLLSHLHPSCTRHSTSHRRAYHRADRAAVVMASITTRGSDEEGVVREIAHLDAILRHEHLR